MHPTDTETRACPHCGRAFGASWPDGPRRWAQLERHQRRCEDERGIATVSYRIDGDHILQESGRIVVDLPDGYRRVRSGAVKSGDQYVNCLLLRDGIVQWEMITAGWIAERRRDDPYLLAMCYGCLARRGLPVMAARTDREGGAL